MIGDVLSSCPYLIVELTPAIPVIGGILLVFVMASLLRTSWTDPGIIPRATAQEAADTERQIGQFQDFTSSLTQINTVFPLIEAGSQIQAGSLTEAGGLKDEYHRTNCTSPRSTVVHCVICAYCVISI